MGKVVLSNRALAAMVSGIERFPDKENGGPLLGRVRKDGIEIIEALEAGEHAIHERGRLSCDTKSVEYMAGTLKGLYEEELEWIGIWHKHNHDQNPPFSKEDEQCHREMCDQKKRDMISILFQKTEEEEYVMRVFRCSPASLLTEEEFEVEDLNKMISYRTW